jgi:hypothetical protein
MNYPTIKSTVLCVAVMAALSSVCHAQTFHRSPLAVADNQKFTVSLDEYPGMKSANPRGWYNSVANVVAAKDGALVAVYRLSDYHTALETYIMVARSADGGRTWTGHRVIAKANVWETQSAWIAPQMSILRDGRIVIISDLGQRHPGQDWPMLSSWQQPNRGMSNHLFWSTDHGRTWSDPQKIDDVGGEPSYIEELSDGTLAFTRTSSAKTDLLKNPPMPWGDIYYRSEVVLSRDGGKTWGESAWLADSPFHGDCEVGLADLGEGNVLAATRIGFGLSRFGNPSRLVRSSDHGRTWSEPTLAPFYGHRIHLGRLQSGKILATYRNWWGSPGSRALVFDPSEEMGFQPTSWIVEEERCGLAADAMTITTAPGKRGAVEFSLYPAQDDLSRVEINATLRVDSADTNGVAISAGVWIHFTPDRIFLGDRPAAGFAFNTRTWHDYRIVRENSRVTIYADGKEMLSAPIDDIWRREVRFGNRAVAGGGDTYSRNQSVSHWRALSAKVTNAIDYSIDWSWKPAQGYPDQFRRDREVVLDHAYFADCGYSSWTQLPDGNIVILDYTTGGDIDGFSWTNSGSGKGPFIRSYVVTENDLTR